MDESDLDLEFNALRLLDSGPRLTLRFGATDASAGLVRANTNSAINQMPDADFVLDPGLVAGPIDYFAMVRLGMALADTEIPRFTGSIKTAEAIDEGIAMKALGGVSMVERLIGTMAVQRVPTAELFHLLARTGGVEEDQLKVDGLDRLPTETFEVVAPIEGLDVVEAIDFAGIRFLPAHIGARVVNGMELDDALASRFVAPAYALALVTTGGMYRAEEAGLGSIDLALAWITTRQRYGLAKLPTGETLSFSRDHALHVVRRGELVAVRGLLTRRRWLREPTSRLREARLSLADDSRRLKPHFGRLNMQRQQALLALRRATTEPDRVARLLALWEAIEFHCASVELPKLFTKAEKKTLKAAIPPGFDQRQREKIETAINFLNTPPLMHRLRELIDEDGVPIGTEEWVLLKKLRDLRNDVVHGKARVIPRADEIDQAISIIARVLVYAIERAAAANS